MTFAESVAIKNIQELAESLNIDCENSLSLYDRQDTFKNLKEMIGPFIYWILPIPRRIKLEIPYLSHMIVDTKALERLKKLIIKLRNEEKTQ